MAGERVKLVVQERHARGSAESRRLRKQGLIPGVLYGRGDPQPFSVEERALRAALSGEGGLHTILDVTLDGKQASHASVVKDYQQDVVRGGIVHVDLHEVRLDQPIHSVVAVHLVGEAAGSREGGVLTQVVNEVNVEALPLEMPPALEVDVSELHIGDSVRVGDIVVPKGVTLLDDSETPIASVTLPTRVEEPEEILDEAEAAAAAEGAPPEEQPEGGSEAPAEPEASAAGGSAPAEG